MLLKIMIVKIKLRLQVPLVLIRQPIRIRLRLIQRRLSHAATVTNDGETANSSRGTAVVNLAKKLAAEYSLCLGR